MVKYTILHGAKENCGDFLIKKAAEDLVKHHTGVSDEDLYDVEIVRNNISESNLDKIRESDVAFLGGGPGYREGFWPNTYPAMDEIIEATTTVLLGPGWKGTDEGNYTFTSESIKVLNRIVDQSSVPYLGARDLPTVRVLRRHGLDAELTGCPAWYISDGFPPTPSFDVGEKVDKIALSTPPKNKPKLLVQFLYLLREIDNQYPDAHIICVYHRGHQDCAFSPVITRPWSAKFRNINASSVIYGLIEQYRKRNGIELYDASGSADYANIYYEADLHIGYRVHGHIPALSSGTPSFLLQIDGRGTGVSESLGTEADVACTNGMRDPVNQIVSNIDESIANNFRNFENVAGNINRGYQKMEKLVQNVTQ